MKRKAKELPTQRNYNRFVEEFSDALGRKYPKICFFLYGSYVDGRLVSGRSDLDGGIILNAEFVTPKRTVMDIAGILARGLSRNRIPVQLNLMDRATNRDGRFLSYTQDYKEWLQGDSVVGYGSDYLKEMRGLDYKLGCLTAIAFNLRAVRNHLLESLDDLAIDPKRFEKGLLESLKTASALPKKLVYLQTGEVIPCRTKSLQEFERIFGQIDSNTLKRILSLLNNPIALFNYAENSDNALQLWQDALTIMETMIRTYVQRFPKISRREVAPQGR